MLHIVDGNHGIFSYGTDSELKDELLSYEDRIFLFGSIVLKSKLDDLEEQKEKFALQGRIVLDEIVRNKELEIFNTKSFYNNLGLDINDISLVKVNEFDNSNNVRVSSKLYPYIGILIGLFIGLSYVVISSGIRRKIEENHF